MTQIMIRHKHRLKPNHHCAERPPFDVIALVLQGGGALGAYQAGAYQALHEAGLEPDWIAGISIGAVNAAIIAGNPRDTRLDRLKDFWDTVTRHPWPDPLTMFGLNDMLAAGHLLGLQAGLHRLGGLQAITFGSAGFFKPNPISPWLMPSGGPLATSWYDTTPLITTLERLIDFDYLGSGKGPRLSVGAVNVESGNLAYFDNRDLRIDPRHIMASGALPPGFPAVDIDGQAYWDGGLVSNTPLTQVVETVPSVDTLVFQLDLWPARGLKPTSMAEVQTRQKDIQYSSRTRAGTSHFSQLQALRAQLEHFLETLPEDLRQGDDYEALHEAARRSVTNVIHLIYRSAAIEGAAKDYDFSALSCRRHWQAGYQDTARTLRHPEVLARPDNPEGLRIFDIHRDGRD